MHAWYSTFDLVVSKLALQALPLITAGAEPGTAFANFPGAFPGAGAGGTEGATVPLLCGGGAFGGTDTLGMVETGYQLAALNRMLASHTHADMCLIGGAGVGKTVLVNEFARLLGYSTPSARAWLGL